MIAITASVAQSPLFGSSELDKPFDNGHITCWAALSQHIKLMDLNYYEPSKYSIFSKSGYLEPMLSMTFFLSLLA